MLEIVSFKKLVSTQKKARELSKIRNSFVVVAQQQTGGKGRFERTWHSGKGGLYCTICLSERNPEQIKYLTFVAALAIVKTLKEEKIVSRIKWPNDVLIGDKKVCGILTEGIFGKENVVLIGIGLNINQKKIPKMDRIPTSLFLETGKKFSEMKILHSLLDNFESLYSLYKKDQFQQIRGLWEKNAHTLGRNIRARTMRGEFVGKAVGIDEHCNLLVETTNGTRTILEGDIFY